MELYSDETLSFFVGLILIDPKTIKEEVIETALIEPVCEATVKGIPSREFKPKRRKIEIIWTDSIRSNKSINKTKSYNINPTPEIEATAKSGKLNLSLDSLGERFEIEKQRHNIRTILLNSNATPIRQHNVVSGYYCSFCKESFPKPADLKAHTIHKHDDNAKNEYMKNATLFSYLIKLDITGLSCNICHKALANVDDLKNHLNSEHQKGLYDTKSYYACFKFNDDKMKCCICETQYHNFKGLLEHMNKHSTNAICDECGASYFNNRQLGFHSGVHAERKFKCPSCDLIFKTNNERSMHVRRAHTTVLIHKCQLCDQRFKQIDGKLQHLTESHGVVFNDYKCNTCERTFKSRNAIAVHKRKDHLMERKYRCSICEQAFFSAGMLKSHEISHTGKRDFKCELCSKTYTRKRGLREHMRSHTGDRRFKCDYCGMAFLQKCSLKGHMKNRHNAKLE